MDMKIGEVREFEGKKYKAIIPNCGCYNYPYCGCLDGCTGCSFEDNCPEELGSVLGNCDDSIRCDEESIVFVEVIE